MPSVTVRVPAKVNVYLGVGARRPDGYHDLANVFQAVSLYDEVTAAEADDLVLEVSGETSDGVPTDESNLAVRAVRALAASVGVEPTARLSVTKAIPVAGGMAGGSADAAGALLACDALWGTALSRDELVEVGARIGADVPFVLVGGTALGSGRGDRLTPVLAHGTFHWVLAFAPVGLATADVYAELDRLRGDAVVPEPAAPDALMAALRAGDAHALATAMANDLGAAASRLQPALRRTLDTGLELGAIGGIVSGSGPTCAFLCASGDEAITVASSLAGAGVCRSTRVVHGPVPGARVVDPESHGLPR